MIASGFLRRFVAGAFVAVALVVAGALPAPAAAYSSYGLGNLQCSTYLERRNEDQQAGTMQNTSFIHAYLSGYLTAGNMLHGLIGDDAKNVEINVHVVVQWLDARCLENRDERVAASLEHFWVEAAEAKKQLKTRGK